MSLSFLIGAIFGSFVFIFAGRSPAQRLLAVVQDRVERNRRKR